MSTDGRLTPRQETFARTVARGDVSLADAARQAGYSDVAYGARNRAQELVANRHVAARIRSYSQSLLDQAGVSGVEAVETIADVMRTARRDADRLKASETVLKLDGALSEGARGDDNRVQVLATLGTGDLSALARLLESESDAERL